ncbi:hypothetical protein PP175_00505 [Aneurinibacillus sp. Ricciae_BoGa-3]|uniref:hypothetical protein n=1 Tax=Aneurinibacillus sp. Ricciae_BoGa-3 TaxID=3022697 RepID=UPI002340FEB9|nr:hypothetical protein [Aneurinibacillus sp. Ricciae_BoGa-3]WCK54594.1 hypothetical protein PP175_00505 [Aneurinibacillus sp. Ricciae_BoGa-3]
MTRAREHSSQLPVVDISGKEKCQSSDPGFLLDEEKVIIIFNFTAYMFIILSLVFSVISLFTFLPLTSLVGWVSSFISLILSVAAIERVRRLDYAIGVTVGELYSTMLMSILSLVWMSVVSYLCSVIY